MKLHVVGSTPRTEIEVDVLIVGAGPVGLYGAYYAGFRGLSVAVIDSLPMVGGQVSALYPEKMIHDVAGHPSVRGRDLIDALVAQAAPYSPQYLLDQTADELDTAGDQLTVTSSDGQVVRCKAIIISGGVGKFVPRTLPVGSEFEGRGLVYHVARPEEYRDKSVVVVGGGDSAFDWAACLEPLASSVTLVHRTSRFRAHQATVRQVTESSAEVLVDSRIVAVDGAGAVESVTVRHEPSGEVRTLEVDGVVAALGFIADLGPLKSWGLEIEGRSILVDSTMATNLAGVFAAGDITDYRGKVRLIAVGFGEIATAVNNAAVMIDPSLDIFPGHSTDVS